MAATARLIVQMTPVEKRALDERAALAGVSTAEFVRRRIGPDELGDRRDEIEAMLTAIENVAPRIQQSLADALALVEETNRSLDRLAQDRP